MKFKNILVTGGLGFIGSNFINFLFKNKQFTPNIVINLDKQSYYSNDDNIFKDLRDKYKFFKENINNRKFVRELLEENSIELVIHFAAESHVDRSILEPDEFIRSNIFGTFQLIEASKDYIDSNKAPSHFKFLHISTDEVYGTLKLEEDAFTEKNPYRPNSPYAASKASSDLIVRSYYKTYDFPSIITNCSNNYGPYQYPEKLIPLVINNCINEIPIPVYGDGMQIRDWIYVEDHCNALLTIAEKGELGEKYNIGGNQEIANISLINKICEILSSYTGKKEKIYKDLISHVKDRPGHDTRYAINNHKILHNLDWKPKIGLDEGLSKTIKWYLNNPTFLKAKSKSMRDWVNKNYKDR